MQEYHIDLPDVGSGREERFLGLQLVSIKMGEELPIDLQPLEVEVSVRERGGVVVNEIWNRRETG